MGIPLLLLLPVLMLVLVGCDQPPPDTEATVQVMVEQALTAVPTPVTAATPTSISHTDRFDLTQGLSTPKISSVDAEVGDKIEVAIELHQKYSPVVGIPCAEDGVFLVDTFGNMTELAFNEKAGARRLDDKLGIVTTFSYGIAFYPAADGEYKVYVGDRYCYIYIQGLSATVHWDIYRQ